MEMDEGSDPTTAGMDIDTHIAADSAHSDDESAHNGSECSAEFDNRQQVIEELWHHDHAHLFRSPMGSAASSIHDDDAILARRLEEDAEETSNESRSTQSPIPEEPPAGADIEAAEGQWFPFRKKVVSGKPMASGLVILILTTCCIALA